MNPTHTDFKYSVTIKCESLILIAAMRGLSWEAEQAMKMIPSGNTGESVWRNNGHRVTFRFTSPKIREQFLENSKTALNGSWEETGGNDNDPAKPKKKSN